MDNHISLKDFIWDIISCYDENYAKEMEIDKLDDEDINNILNNILANNFTRQTIQNEIEQYVGFKRIYRNGVTENDCK